MLEQPPAWLAEYGGAPGAIDRFQSYVSNATVARVHDAWKESSTKPVPFSLWRWHSVAAPGHKQDSRDWLAFHGSMRDFMERGGILAIIGPTRVGKTSFLERMAPLRIIDNSRSGSRRDAPVPPGDVPPGLFAIDETHAHDRRDVARVAADMRAENRGFAMVFQRPESFQDYEIGTHLALQSVQFLELVDHTPR